MGSFSRLLRRAISAHYVARFRAPCKFACIRANVRRGKWKDKDPNSLADLAEAIKDLEVKPKDNGSLSLYLVRSKRQGFRVALLHHVTNNSPNEGFTFLVTPASCLVELSNHPQIVRLWDVRRQHPMLNKHHFGVYGLTGESARLELAAAILRNPNHRIVNWSKKQVKRRARVIARKWLVRKFMQFEAKWQTACFGPALP